MQSFLRACNAADGFVYILTNRSLPGLVKIGYTDRRPDERATELHTTGVPTPFEIAFCFQHSNARSAEKAIHAELGAHRVADGREFFRCEVAHAVDHIIGMFAPENFLDSANLADALRASLAGQPETEMQTVECSTCNGRGEVRVSQGFFSIHQTCPTCHGRGRISTPGRTVIG